MRSTVVGPMQNLKVKLVWAPFSQAMGGVQDMNNGITGEKEFYDHQE